MRIFVNLPHKSWYELNKSDYIFGMPSSKWLSFNQNIEDISKNTFIPVSVDGIEFIVHISNFIFG